MRARSGKPNTEASVEELAAKAEQGLDAARDRRANSEPRDALRRYLEASCRRDESRRRPMSADGRYVAFSTVASNLVPDDSNNAVDVFVRDMALGTVQMAYDSTGRLVHDDPKFP